MQMDKKGILNSSQNLTSSLDKFLFWFSVIDIFFLPYFRFMSVSFSVPLMAIWIILHGREMLSGKEAKAFFLMVSFMIVGTIVGAIYPGSLRWETSFSTTVKRFFQYFICFGYYYFYRYYYRRNKVNINKYLMIFCMVAAIYAVFFMISPRTYANIKIFLNPVDNHTARYLAGTHFYRFNYLWTDPNNIAYLVDGIVMWFIMDEEEIFKNRIIVLLLSSFVILATSSNGGLVILIVELILILAFRIAELRKNSKIRVSTLFSIIGFLILAFIIIRFTSLYGYIQTELVDKLMARWKYYSTSSNITGGRINDFRIALQYLNPLLIFIGTGKEGFTSENGHIYWIGLYGLPSYMGFLYLVFGKFREVKWRNYIWILPFFFAFSFNIAIGEFKWMAIFFTMLAYSRYSINK